MPDKNEQPSQADASQLRGTVENKTPKPAGLLPKKTQQLVILGVAAVLVLIMWMTGGTKRVSTSRPAASPGTRVQPPNPATVEDFKQTIQQQQAARRQPISPSNLERLQTMGLAGDVPPGTVVVPPAETSIPQPGDVVDGTAGQQPAPPDPVKEDRKKREYLSLYSPNVAFTYRAGPEEKQLFQTGSAITPSAAQGVGDRMEPAAEEAEARLRQAESQGTSTNRAPAQMGLSVPTSGSQGNKPAPKEVRNPDGSLSGSFNSHGAKRYVVFEGIVLETLLINRLNGTFAGPINCLVTTDVYSHDRQHVLIPAGTKVLGEAKKVEAFGQQRLAVFFHRLIMPDGYSVSLDQFKGLNQFGETALRDKVNNHYLQIFGASLAIGILGGISEAGTGNVLTSSPLDRARAGLGASLANSSTEILDRFLNILPTVTIREGSRVKVYLSGDLLMSDYAQHTMQPDL
jgi:type IV secretory pathway VirB10-like protein